MSELNELLLEEIAKGATFDEESYAEFIQELYPYKRKECWGYFYKNNGKNTTDFLHSSHEKKKYIFIFSKGIDNNFFVDEFQEIGGWGSIIPHKFSELKGNLKYIINFFDGAILFSSKGYICKVEKKFFIKNIAEIQRVFSHITKGNVGWK